MTKNKPSYLTAGTKQISELQDLSGRGSGFFHIGAGAIPSIIPQALRQKWDSAVVVVSPTAGAMAIIGHRIDRKAGMMDHHPFLVRFSASAPEGRGVLVDHASFDGRSLPLPSNLNALDAGSYYMNHPPFDLSSGSTDQLAPSLRKAFDIAQRALASSCST